MKSDPRRVGAIAEAAEEYRDMKQPPISRHAAATADILEHFTNLLRKGTAPEDIGWIVERVGNMMSRSI